MVKILTSHRYISTDYRGVILSVPYTLNFPYKHFINNYVDTNVIIEMKEVEEQSICPSAGPELVVAVTTVMGQL